MAGISRTDLAQVLGDLAIEMQGQSDTELTLQSIVDGAVAIVPGARWAGISLRKGRKVIPRVPSDPIIAELDSLQTALDDGPSLDALRDHHTVLIEDMVTDTRWPRFAAAAAALGVHSLLSFRLFVDAQSLGSLNLYGSEPGVFDEESMFYGELVAQHSSVALIGSASEAQFRDGLSSRDAIGQAKGILMYRENITGVNAFALMVKASQNSNIKLIDLARWVVEQHEEGLNGSS